MQCVERVRRFGILQFLQEHFEAGRFAEAFELLDGARQAIESPRFAADLAANVADRAVDVVRDVGTAFEHFAERVEEIFDLGSAFGSAAKRSLDASSMVPAFDTPCGTALIVDRLCKMCAAICRKM